MKLKFIIVKFISIILKKYAKESCLYDIIDIKITLLLNWKALNSNK